MPPEASEASGAGLYAVNKPVIILKRFQIPPERHFISNLLNSLQTQRSDPGENGMDI